MEIKVVIDADGCPVVRAACRIAKSMDIGCTVVCDTAHIFRSEELYGADVHVVSQGADSADFYIVNHVSKESVVITQDYGLAAMCMAKCADIIDQNGRIYNNENISGLLEGRAANKKLLRSGKHPKGAPKRKTEQNKAFEESFTKLLKEKKNEQ